MTEADKMAARLKNQQSEEEVKSPATPISTAAKENLIEFDEPTVTSVESQENTAPSMAKTSQAQAPQPAAQPQTGFGGQPQNMEEA